MPWARCNLEVGWKCSTCLRTAFASWDWENMGKANHEATCCISKVVTIGDANSCSNGRASSHPSGVDSMFLQLLLGSLMMAIKMTLGHFHGLFKTSNVAPACLVGYSILAPSYQGCEGIQAAHRCSSQNPPTAACSGPQWPDKGTRRILK